MNVKVWVVYGDDHNYDVMTSWFVGAFSSEEKAKAAKEEDEKRYWKEDPGSKKRGFPHIEIFECELDEIVGIVHK